MDRSQDENRRSDPRTGPEPRAHSDFERALDQGLRIPLDALRASMEELARELPFVVEGDPLHSVLEEVGLLERNVRDLLDYARTPRPDALVCTVGEILRRAEETTQVSESLTLELTAEDPSQRAHVDGPLVARVLGRLLENAVQSGAGSILALARVEAGVFVASVMDDGPRDFDPSECLGQFRTSKPNHLGLGLALVERDVELLGGRFDVHRTPLGKTIARIEIPEGPERPEVNE